MLLPLLINIAILLKYYDSEAASNMGHVKGNLVVSPTLNQSNIILKSS